MSPLRQRLAVVKWYRIYANWYKPDPTRLADRRTKPYLKPRSRKRALGLFVEPPKDLKVHSVHSGPPAVHLDCMGNTREK